MNRKINTVIFLIAATLLNIILLVFFTALLFFLVGLAFSNSSMNGDSLNMVVVLGILICSIVFSMLLYKKILRWAMKRWGLESRIIPIFADKFRHQR